MKFNKKAGKTLMLLAVMGSLLVGGTYAYLTDYKQAINQFTVGKVSINLEEPDWEPEKNTKIVPTQVIKKNPRIKNTGENDAFVYLEVSIPTAEVIVADGSGNRKPKETTELFTFAKNDGWTMISEKELLKDNVKVYTYAYDSVLSPNVTTNTLFDTVTFANVIEGQLDGTIKEIKVRAYAIQTENTGGNTNDIPEKAKNAFTKYVNQNKLQPGKVTD